MNEAHSPEKKLWTASTIFLTIFMCMSFIVTFYFSLIYNLLWCVGLGFFYGVTLAFSYYYDTRKKQSISLIYVIQAAVVFAIIIVFVRLQGIFGPNAFGYDYLVLAFSMLFAGGMFGIPAYRYAKIKPQLTAESEI